MNRINSFLVHRKKRILARMQGMALCRRYSPFLIQLEHNYQKEYEIFLDQENLFWKQKSLVTRWGQKYKVLSHFHSFKEKKKLD